MHTKLYRSNDSMIAGVCGGVGNYFELDPSLVRLIFILLTLAGVFPGVIAYFICAIIMPKEPKGYIREDEEDMEIFDKDGNKVNISTSRQRKTKQLMGILLIVVGALFLFENFFTWFDSGFIWAAVIIALGVGIITKTKTDNKE